MGIGQEKEKTVEEIGLIDGYWQCENCETQYENHDMDPEKLCENCSDDDGQWPCKWIESKKDYMIGFIP